jgi:hypothetical protein
MTRGLLTLTLAVGALFVACDGDGAKPTATDTPQATGTSLPSPTAVPSATPLAGASPTTEPAEAPHAEAPTVDPGLELLITGEMNLNLGAGDVYPFDPIDLGVQQGIEVPPCAAFVFLFGWQVRDPYPPENVNLKFRWTRMGSTETIGEEASGTQSVGCGGIEVVNDSAVPISVEVRWGIAEMQG